MNYENIIDLTPLPPERRPAEPVSVQLDVAADAPRRVVDVEVHEVQLDLAVARVPPPHRVPAHGVAQGVRRGPVRHQLAGRVGDQHVTSVDGRDGWKRKGGV